MNRESALRVGLRGWLTLLLLAWSPALAQEATIDREGPLELDVSRLGPALGTPLSGAELDEATDAIASKMRCPVCQGMAISASPSPMAVAMSEQVRELLSLGYSSEQVWAYFEGSYGEFVRLEPKREGLNWLVWLVPPIALVLGALAVLALQRARTARDDESQEDPEDPREPELERFLQEVRDATRQ